MKTLSESLDLSASVESDAVDSGRAFGHVDKC
jgi:hypothetical protein